MDKLKYIIIDTNPHQINFDKNYMWYVVSSLQTPHLGHCNFAPTIEEAFEKAKAFIEEK